MRLGRSAFRFGEMPKTDCLLQILGFDILLLEDLQPILLEINACPSLSLAHETLGDTESLENLPPTSSVVDEAIKFPLVLDTLRLVMDESDGNTRFGWVELELSLAATFDIYDFC